MDDIMGDVTLEELKEKFSFLLNIAECAVCLECVRQEMVQCVNGHLICFDCKADLKICPTCRDEFSQSKPSYFVSQVIKILPTRCKYKNCPTIIKKEDDHEKYCGFKPTKCKWCAWEGPGKDIQYHCVNVHDSDTVFKNRIRLEFDIHEKLSDFISSEFPGNEFFWEETLNCPETKTFTKTWHLVPNGKPASDLFVTLTFKSESGFFTETTIKLNLDPDLPYEDNSISVPHKMLSHFIDECGTLSYTVLKSTDKQHTKKNI